MRNEFVSSQLERWSRRASIVALWALVAAVLVPDGLVWAAVAGGCLLGSALVAATVLARRVAPSMAEVIAGVEAEPLRALVLSERVARGNGRAGFRLKGDERP